MTMDSILHNVFLAVASIAAAAFTAWAQAAAKRNGVDMTQAQADLLRDGARDAIAFAEEKAADAAAKGLAKITGAQKLSLAIAHLTQSLPSVSPAEADRAIHAALPQAGIGATTEFYDPTKSGN